jgi:hypothetical protein
MSKITIGLGIVVLLLAGAFALWYVAAPPELSPSATPPQVSEPGTISGSTLYPSEFNPAQRVCAQSITDAAYERCTDVPEQLGATPPTFAIKVTPGRYHVYATLKDPAGLGLTETKRAYWTEFVRCGLRAECPSHARIEVNVAAGATVTGVLPHDWYQ